LRQRACNLQRFRDTSRSPSNGEHTSHVASRASPSATKALRAASVLRRQGMLDVEVEDVVRTCFVVPAMEALRDPGVDGTCRISALLDPSVSFGVFTPDVLAALGHEPVPSQWQATAREAFRRQALLRRWSEPENTDEIRGLAWLAYDVSVCSSAARSGSMPSRSELSSLGEVFCCARLPAMQTLHLNASDRGVGQDTLAEVAAGSMILPPFCQDESSGHAERRALLALAARIFRAFPEGTITEGHRVEGLVMLHSQRPPSVASVYAMRSFLHLFPWIQLCASSDGPGCGDVGNATAPSHAEEYPLILAEGADCASDTSGEHTAPKEEIDGAIVWEVVLKKKSEADRFGFLHINGKWDFEKRRRAHQAAQATEHIEPVEPEEGPEILIIKRIHEGGLLERWNQLHPEMEVQPGDCIQSVNGASSVEEMQREIRLHRVVLRCSRSLDSAEPALL